MTSAASTVAVPVTSPPRATASIRARIGYRPQRAATAATVFACRESESANFEHHALDGGNSEPDGPGAGHAGFRRCRQRSPVRARLRSSAAIPVPACTWILGTGRCQLIEHSTPSSGAANAMSCQCAPITAAAKRNPRAGRDCPRQWRCAPAELNFTYRSQRAYSGPLTGSGVPASAAAVLRRRRRPGSCAPTSPAAR